MSTRFLNRMIDSAKAKASFFGFDVDKSTFTTDMAKRATSVFAAAPIVQGKFDGSGVPDALTLSSGSQISNEFYELIDTNQGALSFHITPEWDGDNGIQSYIFQPVNSNDFYVTKEAGGDLRFSICGYTMFADASSWTAGTTYYITMRWDSKNTLDGTNYACVSINDLHTFGITTQPIAPEPGNTLFIGKRYTNTKPANAIIEGLTIYRRVLFDGTYGEDVGNGDEINLIYAAGVGADPTLITGSWDVTFCLPTDASPGALTTGDKQAWSHPHDKVVMNDTFLTEGNTPGTTLEFDGANTNINCGSDASLDDLHDEEFTVDCWAKIDGWGESDTGHLIGKSFITTGWTFYIKEGLSGGLSGFVLCETTHADSRTGVEAFVPDGKWHHFTMYFNDAGDRKIYLAIDGVWAVSYLRQYEGVGAVNTDVTTELVIGDKEDLSRTFDGSIAWVRISDNDRYSHGTDFIPPSIDSPPATDGNTVEQWNLNEGTGATASAEVAGANDGTITSGTWVESWESEGSPVTPKSVVFDGTATVINCGSDASLDDLHDDAFTVEAWIRADGWGEIDAGAIAWKTAWSLRLSQSYGTIQASIDCATTDAHVRIGTGEFTVDNKWYHVTMFFDDAGDRKIYVALDGIWDTSYERQIAGVGAIVSDTGEDLAIGATPAGSAAFDGALAWLRISDNDRYAHGTDFTPPSRTVPPADDANTVSLWRMEEGAGVTVADANANGNDGTITSGSWNNVIDMATDAPGDRMFNWGYTVAGASSGIAQTLTGLSAGQSYVIRVPISYDASSRAQPRIFIRDVTNDVEITHLDGPWLYGVHNGGDGQASLSDTLAPYWPASLVGATVYNITDGSSVTITAAGDSIVGVLAGGTDNDWDGGDEYRIVPASTWVWCEPFTFELPTIARNGSAADCVACEYGVINRSDGEVYVQQFEAQENLIDNPSMTEIAGDPGVPDGWGVGNLDAGDAESETVIVHSGVSSIQFNVGATASEYMSQTITRVIGQHYAWGGWGYVASGQLALIASTITRWAKQAEVSGDPRLYLGNGSQWQHKSSVVRAIEAIVTADNNVRGGGVEGYVDDVYLVPLNPVTLTVTPASEANSTETSGLRVDGYDTLTQPIPAGKLGATSGEVRFKWTPRHGAGVGESFGNADPKIAHFYKDGSNEVEIRRPTNVNIDMRFEVGGVATVAIAWDSTGVIVAGTTYDVILKYTATQCTVSFDGTIRLTVTPGAGIDFGANIPDIAHWGGGASGTQQDDATFAAP